MLLLYSIVFALAYSQAALFSGNQNTKFISGLAMAGYGDVASDWMARITDPFPLFSHLLELQYRLFGLHFAVHGSFYLLTGLYGFLGVFITRKLYRENSAKNAAFGLFALIWLFIHTVGIRHYFQSFFPEGLAGQYLMGDYYQPCCFGVLLLAAVAAYMSRRVLLSAICLVAAALFHPTYLISSALIAAALVMVPANKDLGISWSRRLLFFVFVGVSIGAYAMWNSTILTSGDPVLRDAAYRLMAETRIPHHALPSHWNLFKTISFFVTGSAAAWIGRKQLAGQILFVLLCLVLASVLWAMVDYNPMIAVVAPWRLSVVLAPLSWIVLIAWAAGWLSDEKAADWARSGLLKPVIALICFCVCAGGIYDLGIDYKKKVKRKDYALARFLEKNHTAGHQYLIPPGEKGLRLEAGVPVFVTIKSHPTKDSEFLAWHDRLKNAQAVYGGSGKTLQGLIADRVVTHMVWPASQGDFPFSSIGRRIYSDSYFSLWDLKVR